MSRLIVKNLPAYLTSDQLKEHFLQKKGPGGDITDLKVARQSDGRSRRFAFIGFRTEDEAAKSQQWFDRTYLGTTKISVQLAENGLKNAPNPRPNKRPRIETTAEDHTRSFTAPQKDKDDVRQSSPSPDSAQLGDFLKVMQPRTKEKTWANDVASVPPIQTASTGPPEAIQDQEEGADTTTVEETEVLDDLEWLKRRTVAGIVKQGTGDLHTEDGNITRPSAQVAQESVTNGVDGEPAIDTILRTGRLFLRNLPFSCSDEDIKKLFSSFGEVSQVHIPMDHATKSSIGLGFVTFVDPSAAVKAYEGLDKTSFQGRLLHILPAMERSGSTSKAPYDEFGKVDVRGEREKQRKDTAGKEFNWSMLYMNSDAVASSVADRMNISKADILNPDITSSDSSSAAVKLALAETHIIQETKSYLESEGINLSSFSSLFSAGSGRPRRSQTCILVKNIPYGTTAQQINELFEPHGELNRVLVPPAGTIAVVDFVHADEAAKGFKAVAYRRMGSSIIYLEKAPMGVFDGAPPFAQRSNNVVGPTTAAREPIKIDDGVEGDQAEDSAIVPGSTLYVKNLSFSTTTERLASVFGNLPAFSFARVQTKPGPKYAGTANAEAAPRLSMGFGFIGFKTPDAAKNAMKSIHGFALDGHALSVKFAGRGTEEEQKGKGGVSSTTTKMIVKNVPFEATKKEIRELFGAHGQLKSVRLPKKMNSRTRGFAFLDFVTRHEAENAYSALRHTHLLGRHLVLEWAEDTSKDIDALRKKTGVGFGDGSELPGRKRKLNLRDDDGDDGGDE